jgi:hypothetical protein
VPATRQDLFARLDELGIASTTLEHEDRPRASASRAADAGAGGAGGLSVPPCALIKQGLPRDGDPGCRYDAHERLNHPLENTATTNIAREDLVRFIRSCGHEPRIMAVAGAR